MTLPFLALPAIPGVDLTALTESALVTMGVEWGMRAVYAAILLIVGLWLAFFVSGRVQKRLRKSRHIDPTLGRFFGALIRYALVAVVIIAVLQKFGVQTTSLVAMLGAAALAVGLALQGALRDVASGVLIVIFRPYRIGDVVDIGGKQGTVDDISLFYTALNTIDNRRVIIHNSRAWGDVIENFTINPVRRIDLTVGISYDDDIDHAIAVVKKVCADYIAIHGEPPPEVAVRELGSSSVNLVVRCWTAMETFMATQWELTKRIKQAFDANGISIPYPHQVSINRIETPAGTKPAQRILLAEQASGKGEAPERPGEGG